MFIGEVFKFLFLFGIGGSMYLFGNFYKILLIRIVKIVIWILIFNYFKNFFDREYWE